MPPATDARDSTGIGRSNHAGQMWNSTKRTFVHHFPHPYWSNYRNRSETVNRTPIPDRRLASSFEEANKGKTHKADARTEVAPLSFSGRFAGGLIADIKRRAPYYWDDLIEPLRAENRGQALASCIFLFFACLSPAITFGMLFSDGTGGQLGVVETLLSSGLSGVLYALLSGQPLAILGATGPELAYTIVFYRMCTSLGLEFLPARVWECAPAGRTRVYSSAARGACEHPAANVPHANVPHENVPRAACGCAGGCGRPSSRCSSRYLTCPH